MSDMGGRMRDATNSIRDKVEEAAQTVRSTVVRSAEEAAQSAQASGGTLDAAEHLRRAALDTSVSLGEAVKASIERQPFTALAVAAAAGFVFGLLFFRRT